MESRRKRAAEWVNNPVCPLCYDIHSRAASIEKSTGRRSSVCEKCYPLFRKATNLFFAAKERSVRQNIEFDLNINWIIEKIKLGCPYLGVEFKLGNTGNNYKSRDPLTPSIDKINPKLGYTENNCQVVSWWYNSSKQQFTDSEVLEFCKKVVSVSEKKHAQTAEKMDEIKQVII